MNFQARENNARTARLLSEESMEYCRSLPRSLHIGDAWFVHGYPPDSARTYLFQKTLYELKKTFQEMAERICFVGHTHDLEIVTYDGFGVMRRALGQGITTLDSNHHYIINVGSVGQPRDGNNKAKYVIWNQDADAVELRFIAYDIALTVAKIKNAGLPEQHAARLY